MINRVLYKFIVLFILVFLPVSALAGHRNTFELFPSAVIYEPYLASPLEPRFKLGRTSVHNSSIPETGKSRWELKAGRQIGLMRFNETWQINIFGGFMASFDVEESTDSIAWDGLFGTQLVRTLGDKTAVKFGLLHQSAHRGDEFIERTGRNRIDYTRQETNIGLSHNWTRIMRIYLEGGWATTLRNPAVQEEGRFEAGFEYGIPTGTHKTAGTLESGWYAATNIESMEERNWSFDITANAGWFFFKHSRLWRIGFEYRNGRVPFGEFFNQDEKYIGVAIWNDFL